MRETFLYNNLMFAAVGYLIELQSGKTWEQFVKEKIFDPLQMNSTGYSIAEMLKRRNSALGLRNGAIPSSFIGFLTTRTYPAWLLAELSFPTSKTCLIG